MKHIEFRINLIKEKVKNYIIDNKINSLIIGVSGGLDSGVNCILLKDVCDELNIPLIGRYIHIETNKEEEANAAKLIGNNYCTSFDMKDLTNDYFFTIYDDYPNNTQLKTEYSKSETESELQYKIRLGNIKARLRMIHLYNLSQKYKGLVIDNDNLTEQLLGFWTLHGDVGDLTPLSSLYKTDVYNIAKFLFDKEENEAKKTAIKAIIDITPTDGLGITNSDFEQFGVKSYNEIDEILKSFKEPSLSNIRDKYGDSFEKVLNRYINSEYKRNNPFRIKS